LIGDKDGDVWKQIADELGLQKDRFEILESRGRDRDAIKKELESNKFREKYWDGRVFGNTFLEEGAADTIKTGVVQFGLGISVAPIEISRHTNTNKAGVQEGKDRGMAPMGYRFVSHGVYCMPFFVNPSAAHKSGCTKQDIEVLLKVIPFAYSHTRSHARPMVEVRHAWYIEHKNALGSCSDFALIDALTPRKKQDAEKPSKKWDDYDVPNDLPESLKVKVGTVRDLANLS
jgi:Cas7 group CRISPR-associated protein Csh2